MKIAVVGGGVAGIVAAHLLVKKHEVVLFEANDYLGGHTNTRVINEGADSGTAVDTGFIVCNKKNYPNFYRFLDSLNVARQDSDMCFGFNNRNNDFTYNGPTFKHFMVEPKNLLQPGFLWMIYEKYKFSTKAISDLKYNRVGDISIVEYCAGLGMSTFFMQHYLIPLAASIWSSSDESMAHFPAITFLRFFDNHGILDLSKLPKWQTIVGGSHTYIKEFKKYFIGSIRLSTPVNKIDRFNNTISVFTEKYGEEKYDHVVLATHADISLRMLSNPSEQEKAYLSKWRYASNNTVLHTDTSFLPKKEKLWASWNYVKDSNLLKPVNITYYMNRLQNLKTKNRYLVTLNQSDFIKSTDKIYETNYEHPIYTPQSVETQKKLQEVQGENSTWFCGSYLGYGFHEDAVTSAFKVAQKFGIEL